MSDDNTLIDPVLVVTTDQTDYVPNSTATITAENVTVGGSVEAKDLFGLFDDTIARLRKASSR